MSQSTNYSTPLLPSADRNYDYYEVSGRTAKQVRKAYLEPELKHLSMGENKLKNAMGKMNKIVSGATRATSKSTVSSQGTGSLTFDNLPYDVKSVIFRMVHSMPGWVHLKFKGDELNKLSAGNQEIYVNREWHQAPELRPGLSYISRRRSKSTGQITVLTCVIPAPITNMISDHALQKGNPTSGSPFINRHTGSAAIPIKKQIDWFFFDGPDMTHSYMKCMWYSMSTIYGARTCVFRLEDIYDCIRHNDGRRRQNPAPSMAWSMRSKLEELVILVGEFRKDVLPSKMKEIKAFWADELSESINREAIDYGKDISNAENCMMGYVTEKWSLAITQKRADREKWLDNAEGKQVLAYEVHGHHNKLSEFLSTLEGHRWINSKGSSFLASESGWWWLASELGYPWLETKEGVRWLGTGDGKDFLESPQALAWANTSTREPSEIDPLGTQVQKAWFETGPGQKWKHENCPSGNPPNPPERPLDLPAPNIQLPRDPFAVNHNFRGWRYVKCPPVEAT
ncbi:hypothetical protein M426DRAFT_23098 [Hypoxylon sp. CI-4A]|nr:hypothetical protein M426DRAFT_23098 [Hypoxylon sp. CI-4A]